MSDAGPLACAVCLEATEFADLPCCQSKDPADSTTRFYLDCLRLLCEHAGGVDGMDGLEPESLESWEDSRR